MSNAIKAGALYFAIVFFVGFLLGTTRVLLLIPQFGETVSVLLEGPFILGASWFVCGYAVRRARVEATVASRFAMGVCAFGLLMIAEVLLGVVGFGRSIDEQIASYATTPGFLGLAGQILFGLFPVIRLYLIAEKN